MLVVNPRDRISISEILKHPWIQLYDSILPDDKEYPGGVDITLHSFDDQQAASHNQQVIPGLGDDHQCLFQASNHINSNELLSTVNVDNLYKEGCVTGRKQRLSYADYCAITQDFATMHLNESVLHTMEVDMGMPRRLVKEHINRGDLNHATSTYQLMVMHN